MIPGLLVALLMACWTLLLVWYRRPLHAFWREPVLKHPVLILESDDWGAGPAEQVPALRALQELLSARHDAAGNPPVMTLGVVLAAIEGLNPEEGRLQMSTLRDSVNAEVLAALRHGEAAGVLVPQLHGFAHFEPSVLAKAATVDPAVAAWCVEAAPRWTEDLPSSLQSALIDGAGLPSGELSPAVIADSIARQGELWRDLFGSPPRVAVPTTFIWNDVAEAAWGAAGVRWLVTPGHRATRRERDGNPARPDRRCLTGQRSPAGLVYLVRDVYFEPARGHGISTVLLALATRIAEGRACLIETHRFNYAGPHATSQSLDRLGTLLDAALRQYPSLRFLSTEALGRALEARDPALVAGSLGPRLRAWLARSVGLPRFGRLATLSGLLPVLRGIAWVLP